MENKNLSEVLPTAEDYEGRVLSNRDQVLGNPNNIGTKIEFREGLDDRHRGKSRGSKSNFWKRRREVAKREHPKNLE